MSMSKILQFNLVKFPIIFPLIYGYILFNFPHLEQQLILITILLLGETHFGATWPFFINKNNSPYLKDKRIELIVIPLIISILSLIGFIYFKNFFLLIFFIANIYHVTRQSYGICKLYCKDEIQSNFQSNLIYIFNFIFFIIAFFRFYLPFISSDHIFFLNLSVLILILLSILFYIFKFGFNQNLFIFLTGILIFYPVCFVENPVHVILMGVTMHYTQYLYLTSRVNKLRLDDFETNKNRVKFKVFNFALIVVTYALIMTFFSSLGDNKIYNFLIFIPILGQMLHFYIDSQIWKFREEHNREYTLKYISKILS